MSETIDKRLADVGITLPTPAPPIANYVGFVKTGNLLFVSGQLCFENGPLVAKEKLAAQLTLDR